MDSLQHMVVVVDDSNADSGGKWGGNRCVHSLQHMVVVVDDSNADSGGKWGGNRCVHSLQHMLVAAWSCPTADQ